MAKKIKIKNFKVEQNELQPMTVGVFENRKTSSVGIFFIMTLFIAVIIFLPEISAYINGYLNPVEKPVIKPGLEPTPMEPPEEEPNYDEEFYNFQDNPSLTRDDILFDTFLLDKENNLLSLNITNNQKTTVVIGNLNFYLELYNEEQTLLERVKITGSSNMTSGSNTVFTKDISTEALEYATQFVLVQKEKDAYPPIELETDSDGMQSLVCTKGNEEVTYKFKNNLLKEFESKFSYRKPTEMLDEEYMVVYQAYQRDTNNLDAKEGITSTFFMHDGGFDITTNVNLQDAERTYVFSADTFLLDEEAKTVNFEIEAQGFSCE